MNVITVCNQKGGVGKTSTVAALAAGFSRHGLRVLAIDGDPQQSLSSVCAAQAQLYTLYDVATGKRPAAAAIRPTTQGFDILPGDQRLFDNPDYIKLHSFNLMLSGLTGKYDYVVIDTPPALSIITMSAIVSSDHVIIPAWPDVLSLYGLDQIDNVLKDLQHENAPAVYVLLTKYSNRRNIDRTMKEAIEARAAAMGAKVFGTTIRSGVTVPESQLMKRDVFSYAPRASVTADYENLVSEFLKEVNNNG